jgi:5'-nucleotidase
MKILVSNDDGYLAQGIKSLVSGLINGKADHEINIVAPDRDRSGASNSLTLDRPLLPIKFNYFEDSFDSKDLNKCYFVNGTPTDCVHIGITGLLKVSPDIVISGINAGANMGDDVLYSGTIAAATEGRHLGLPAIAVSLNLETQDSTLDNNIHYQTAAHFVNLFLNQLSTCPLPDDTILNINVPNLPWENIRGILTTRLGKRHKSEPAIELKDPRNRRIFWIGPIGQQADAGPGTDFYAVEQGYISISPLKIDQTDNKSLDPLEKWISSDTMASAFPFSK